MTVRELYGHNDAELALEFVDRLADDMIDAVQSIEVRSLGRTRSRWRLQIAAWHTSRVSNGPTEAANNLIKRVKRAAFGFTKFANYRIRSLLYAGKPDSSLIGVVRPR
ncbi:MAG: transposase [Acidimicrobiales bacterium]